MTRDGRGYAVLRKRVTCKKCGCDHVCWYQTKSGKWILLEGKIDSQGNGVWAAGGNFHKCEEYLKTEADKKEYNQEKEINQKINSLTLDQKLDIVFNKIENGEYKEDYYKPTYENAPSEEARQKILYTWLKEYFEGKGA